MEKFTDRYQAGKILAKHLKDYTRRSDVIVLALPRGGVPVAYEIAKELSVPLDVFIVRKLGVPGQVELAMGALAMDGQVVFNQEIISELHISKDAINQVIQQEQAELNRRVRTYRGDKPLPVLTDKIIILVDDGIATGATMRAAIQSLRRQKPTSIIAAVPVAEVTICTAMAKLADKIICPLQPQNFYAVGAWYDSFSQTSDEEVHDLLAES